MLKTVFDHIFQQLEVMKDHIIIGTTWYVRREKWRNLEEIWYDCYDQSCLELIPWRYSKTPGYKSYFQLSSQSLKMWSTWSLIITSRIQILIKCWNSGLQWILLWSIIKDTNNQKNQSKFQTTTYIIMWTCNKLWWETTQNLST